MGPLAASASEVIRETLAADQRRFALRKDLDAARRDQHRVLELGRERAIFGHRGPIVVLHHDLEVADVDHRLDSEGHAWLEAVFPSPNAPIVFPLALLGILGRAPGPPKTPPPPNP